MAFQARLPRPLILSSSPGPALQKLAQAPEALPAALPGLKALMSESTEAEVLCCRKVRIVESLLTGVWQRGVICWPPSIPRWHTPGGGNLNKGTLRQQNFSTSALQFSSALSPGRAAGSARESGRAVEVQGQDGCLTAEDHEPEVGRR